MATSPSLKTPESRTSCSTAPISSARGLLRKPSAMERGADDVCDQLVIRNARLFGRGSDAGIGFEARVGIDLENVGLSVFIDAEIDPRIAGYSKESPARRGMPLQRRIQIGLGVAPVEHPRGVLIVGGVLVPFGGVADDARAPVVPFLENHLADRQNRRRSVLLDQGNVEFAPLDIALRD